MADWTTDESDQDENNPLLASSASDDDAQLLNIQGSDGGTPLPTYRLAGLGTRVWVVLSLFLLSTLQAMCWNVFAPVFSTVHAVYGWDDTEVEWLANVANIGMLCALPFTTIIVGALGPRVPTILTAMLMMLCTGLRVVPRIYTDSTGHEMDSRMVLSLNVVSMIINGASAAVSFDLFGLCTVDVSLLSRPSCAILSGFLFLDQCSPRSGFHRPTEPQSLLFSRLHRTLG